MADGGSINLRLSLKGAEQVRAELDKIGPAGAKMGRELDRAMREPSAGLKAIDAGSKEARKGLDDFAGRAGPVGNILSQLGPWGLAAAAGLGLVGIAAGLAMRKLQDAMKIAADLTDTADRIGVSTTALQEWSYVADEAGVPVQALQANLEKLNGVIGAFKSGIGDGKLKPVFEELGITTESLATVKDAEGMMYLLADSLGQIKDRALQVKFARALGVEESLPILRLGSDGIRELAAEAERLGLVMGKDVVKALDDADRKIEVAQQRIDMSMRLSVAGLADDFASLVGSIAEVVNWLTKLDDKLKKIEIPHMQRGLLAIADDAARGRTAEQGNEAREQEIRNQPGWMTWLGVNQQERHRLDEQDRRSASLRAGLADLANGTGEYAETKGGFEPKGHTSGGSSGPSKAEREAEQRRREAQRTIDALDKDEVAATRDWIVQTIGRTDTVASRAEVARRLLELDENEQARTLKEAEEKVKAGGLMTEEVQLRFDRIRDLRMDASAARGGAAAEKETQEQRKLMLEVEKIHADTTTQILQMASSEARTAAERRTIEAQILAIAQRRQRADMEAAIEAEKEPAKRAALVAALGRLAELQEGQTREMQRRTAGPLEAWKDKQIKSGGEASEWLQGQALDALDGVNAGLIDAWRNADSAGDALAKMGQVGVNALQQITDALLKMAIQRMMIEPLANALFGAGSGGGGGTGLLGSFLGNFASSLFGSKTAGTATPAITPGKLASSMRRGMARGGVNGAAGLVPVGEYGMEVVDMPVGARVHDADRTQRTLLDFDARMRAMAESGGTARAPTINVPIHVVNKTSEPVSARTNKMPDGGIEMILEPAVRGTVSKMGADGSLAKANGYTPRGIKR